MSDQSDGNRGGEGDPGRYCSAVGRGRIPGAILVIRRQKILNSAGGRPGVWIDLLFVYRYGTNWESGPQFGEGLIAGQ